LGQPIAICATEKIATTSRVARKGAAWRENFAVRWIFCNFVAGGDCFSV